MGIGFLAALSLVPYVSSIFRVREWDVISRIELPASLLLQRITYALCLQRPTIALVWYGSVFAVLLIPVLLTMRRKQAGVNRDDTHVFIFLTGIVALGTLVVFVKSVGYATMPWQYLPFMGLIACLAECSLQRLWANDRGWLMRSAIACLIVLSGIQSIRQQAHLRRTNLDIITNELVEHARSDDLIVVSPFYLTVGFAYHGKKIAANWTSLPPIPVSEASRPFPHMKAAMASVNPIAPVLEMVTATLKKGRRVWLVGNFNFLPAGKIPPLLLAAPDPVYGWNFGPYAESWSMQIGFLLQSHAAAAKNIPVSSGIAVNPLENLDLILVSGWK